MTADSKLCQEKYIYNIYQTEAENKAFETIILNNYNYYQLSVF